MAKDEIPVIRGHNFKANANMSEIKSAHRPKFTQVSSGPPEQLQRLNLLAERIRRRKNINKYVFGKTE